MAVVTARTTPAEQTLVDRLLAAAPLLSIFLWLAIIYVIQAWAHKTPWLFGDELELTQLSRAIADTGHAARRGEPYSFTTLWTYVLAPAWLIDNLHAAYATVKYLTVIVMTATVFPAYAIARMLVGRRPALFVAAASGAIPAVAYSSMIVEEPFAYFWSTLALFLIMRALITPSRWWIGGAVVASLIAPLVRGELAVIPDGLPARRGVPALAVRLRQPVAPDLEHVGLGGLRDTRGRRGRDRQRGARSPLTRMELRDPPLQGPHARSRAERRRRVDDRPRRAPRGGGTGGTLARTR